MYQRYSVVILNVMTHASLLSERVMSFQSSTSPKQSCINCSIK